MKWLALFVLAIVLVSLAVADGEIWEEDDHEVLIRNERGAKNTGKIFGVAVAAFVSSAALYRLYMCMKHGKGTSKQYAKRCPDAETGKCKETKETMVKPKCFGEHAADGHQKRSLTEILERPMADIQLEKESTVSAIRPDPVRQTDQYSEPAGDKKLLQKKSPNELNKGSLYSQTTKHSEPADDQQYPPKHQLQKKLPYELNQSSSGSQTVKDQQDPSKHQTYTKHESTMAKYCPDPEKCKGSSAKPTCYDDPAACKYLMGKLTELRDDSGADRQLEKQSIASANKFPQSIASAKKSPQSISSANKSPQSMAPADKFPGELNEGSLDPQSGKHFDPTEYHQKPAIGDALWKLGSYKPVKVQSSDHSFRLGTFSAKHHGERNQTHSKPKDASWKLGTWKMASSHDKSIASWKLGTFSSTNDTNDKKQRSPQSGHRAEERPSIDVQK